MNLFQGKGKKFLLTQTELGEITISESMVLGLLTETLMVTAGVTDARIRAFSFSQPGLCYEAGVILSENCDRERAFEKAKRLARQVLAERSGIPVFAQELYAENGGK